jgi:hypothetical protein
MIQDPWIETDRHRGLAYYADKGNKSEAPAHTPPLTTHDPRKAYELVLERAGCFPRDILTREVVEDVKNRTGTWGRRRVDDLMDGLRAGVRPKDEDNDGIADEWENVHGLDSTDSLDYNTVMESGYTAIEEYLNQLAQKLLPQ